MAWNQPGGGKDRDPWSSGGREQGPPDLDEVVRRLQQRLGGLFGRGKGGGGGGLGSRGFWGIAAVVLVGWLLTGFYIVDPAERGVELRFGRYTETTGPGPNWHLPYPVETVIKVNVDELRTTSHRAQMLTQDENLIQIALAVQYQVKDAESYLFRVRDPDYTLAEATESALREVVGSKRLDDILSEAGGRLVLVNETEKNIQNILDRYETGLRVTKVNLESAQPPEEVQAAFEDAIKAREDEDRLKKQAEAYARDKIPKAEGDVQRLIEEAEAYKQQVVERARGETSRFLQTLGEYAKAPEVTRKRLYIETMEQILATTSKVLIKVREGTNILYLPLERMLTGQGGAELPPLKSPALERSSPSIEETRRRESVRARERR